MNFVLQIFWLSDLPPLPHQSRLFQSATHLTQMSKSQTTLTPVKKEVELKSVTKFSPVKDCKITKNANLKIFGSSSQISGKNASSSYADYENYFYI